MNPTAQRVNSVIVDLAYTGLVKKFTKKIKKTWVDPGQSIRLLGLGTGLITVNTPHV